MHSFTKPEINWRGYSISDDSIFNILGMDVVLTSSVCAVAYKE